MNPGVAPGFSVKASFYPLSLAENIGWAVGWTCSKEEGGNLSQLAANQVAETVGSACSRLTLL